MTCVAMRGYLSEFAADQDGSAAVDWVALAAGVLLLGIATAYALFSVGVDDVAAAIDQAMLEADCNEIVGPTIALGAAGPEQERNCPGPGPAPSFE